jgi:hypothetical protein
VPPCHNVGDNGCIPFTVDELLPVIFNKMKFMVEYPPKTFGDSFSCDSLSMNFTIYNELGHEEVVHTFKGSRDFEKIIQKNLCRISINYTELLNIVGEKLASYKVSKFNYLSSFRTSLQ